MEKSMSLISDFVVQQEVVRLDVAVHPLALVQMLQRRCALLNDLREVGQHARMVRAKNLFQVQVREQFQHQIGDLALHLHVVHADDVGMGQRVGDFIFVLQVAGLLLLSPVLATEDFKNETATVFFGCLPDLARVAGADEPCPAVGAEMVRQAGHKSLRGPQGGIRAVVPKA